MPIGPTALIDLSGDGAVVAAVHRRLGASLVHSSIVGATHRFAEPVDTAALPGAPRTFFIAPEVASALSASVGDAAVESALGAAWRAFATQMHTWLRIRRGVGPIEVQSAYRQLLEGSASPRDGIVLTMRS